MKQEFSKACFIDIKMYCSICVLLISFACIIFTSTSPDMYCKFFAFAFNRVLIAPDRLVLHPKSLFRATIIDSISPLAPNLRGIHTFMVDNYFADISTSTNSPGLVSFLKNGLVSFFKE